MLIRLADSYLVPAEGGEGEESPVAPPPDGGAVGVDVGEVALQPLRRRDGRLHLHRAETLVHSEPPLVALRKCVFKRDCQRGPKKFSQ